MLDRNPVVESLIQELDECIPLQRDAVVYFSSLDMAESFRTGQETTSPMTHNASRVRKLLEGLKTVYSGLESSR